MTGLPVRFQRQVNRTERCWLWMGQTTYDGYGRYYRDGKYRRAHRLSYEAARGPIPDGTQLDHLCRVRNCVNPDHLEAVTARVNVLRSDGLAAENARKVECVNGHTFDYLDAKGKRKCRTCRRESDRRRYWAKRQPVSA